MCIRDRHLAALVPPLDTDIDDVGVRANRTGRPRVAEAFRVALKRNEIAARSMRAVGLHAGRCAVSRKELHRHRQQRIDALNIDIGILYASSMVAESAVLSRGKLLPGSIAHWRRNTHYWARALAIVSRIYLGRRRKEGIVSSVLTVPRFLQVVQARAHTLF